MSSSPLVLVVEDDPDLCETLAESLEDEGYTVLRATDGAAALAILTTRTPSCVLLDLVLPVLDGWQLYNEMHADDRLANIPVFAVSRAAEGAPDGAEKIKKPFDLGRLVSLIKARVPLPERSD